MERRSDDAVGFFSENAKMFHDLYRAQPEYLERIEVWNGLLDRYAKKGASALDLGCGPGIFSLYLAQKGCNVVGVDGAPDMIERCEAQRERLGLGNARFVQARLPLPAEREADFGTVDLVISSSVVEYVDDIDAVLAQFARLLKPSGILVVSMPNVASVSRIFQRVKYKLTNEPEIYRHIRHFSSPPLLRRRVARHGLRLLESHYYTHYTRIAKLGHALRLPKLVTEDLFVTVFQKA